MRARAVGAAALWAACLLAFASPWGPWSVSDDWAYSDQVRLLLETGRLRMPELAAATSLLHILWGALWCLPGGFSLSVLRLSTLAASAGACAGMAAWLLAFGASEAVAFLGAAVLAFDPVFVGASYSFYTDVPFLALLIWSLWAYRRGKLALGSVLAALAYLSRQVALAAPLAAAYVLWKDGAKPRKLLAAAGFPLAVAAAHAGWFAWIHGTTMGSRDHALDAWLRLSSPLLLARDAFDRAGLGLQYVALGLAPLAPLLVPRAFKEKRFGVPAALCAALLALALWRHGPFPNLLDQLSVRGLGLADLDGFPQKPAGWFGARALWWAWNALGAAAVLAAACRRPPEDLRLPAAAGALLLAPIVLHGPLYDRYFLVFLPLAAAAALAGERRAVPASWVLAFAAALVSLMGARDFVHWNEAVRKAAAEAARLGIRPEEVSAGIAWDGAHTAAANIATLMAQGAPTPTEWWRLNRYKALVSFDPRPPGEGFSPAGAFEYNSPFLQNPASVHLYVAAQVPPGNPHDNPL